MGFINVQNFQLIRIECHHDNCRMAFELSPDSIVAAMNKTNGCCPLCGKPFTLPTVEGGANVIANLARVIIALRALSPNVGVEFPVRIATQC